MPVNNRAVLRGESLANYLARIAATPTVVPIKSLDKSVRKKMGSTGPELKSLRYATMYRMARNGDIPKLHENSLRGSGPFGQCIVTDEGLQHWNNETGLWRVNLVHLQAYDVENSETLQKVWEAEKMRTILVTGNSSTTMAIMPTYIACTLAEASRKRGPVDMKFDPRDSFTEHLRELKQRRLQASIHTDMPLEPYTATNGNPLQSGVRASMLVVDDVGAFNPWIGGRS